MQPQITPVEILAEPSYPEAERHKYICTSCTGYLLVHHEHAMAAVQGGH